LKKGPVELYGDQLKAVYRRFSTCYIINAQQLRQTGHNGDEDEELTKEQALECHQWAAEFMQAVKEYLGV
jgi:hypothetical protein